MSMGRSGSPNGRFGRVSPSGLSLARLEQFWLKPVDAAPYVVARTGYGLLVTGWALSLVPDFDLIFGSQSLNDPFYPTWRVLSLFRFVDQPLVLGAGLAALIVSGAAVAVGHFTRLSLPLAALLQISLADYASAWSIGAESVMRLIGLFFGAFGLITATDRQGTATTAGHPGANPNGMIARWPVLLVQLQILLVYLTSGLEKLRGAEWQEGSAAYHALEIEHLRRFEAPEFLTSTSVLVTLMSWSTVIIELGLPVLLIWPRTRKLALLLAVILHLGFDVFLELGFFGPAMVVGLACFLDAPSAKRLLRRWPFRG